MIEITKAVIVMAVTRTGLAPSDSPSERKQSTYQSILYHPHLLCLKPIQFRLLTLSAAAPAFLVAPSSGHASGLDQYFHNYNVMNLKPYVLHVVYMNFVESTYSMMYGKVCFHSSIASIVRNILKLDFR